MDVKKEIISEVGPTKAANKAKKKSMETYGHDALVSSPEQAKRARSALDKAKTDKSGAVKRATFRAQRAMESLIIERIAANKELKNKIVSRKNRDAITTDSSNKMKPGAEGAAGLTAAGAMRREGKKATAKLFLKATKGKKPTLEALIMERAKNNPWAICHSSVGKKKTPKFERCVKDIKKKSQLESLIIERFTLLLEGREDTDTDDDSISNAGGDASVYNKIKAAKQQGSDDRSTIDSLVKKHNIEPNRKTGKISRRSFRREILGKLGGMKDKQGNSPQKKEGPKAFKKGSIQKPLPLNIKGKPHPGKKMGNVRGKSVNTSRSGGVSRVPTKE